MSKRTFFLGMFVLSIFVFPVFASSDLIEIGVKGLTDDASEEVLRKNLESLQETDIAEVDSTTGRAFISLKEGVVLPDTVIMRIVEEAGYQVLNITRSGVKGVVQDRIQPSAR